MRQKIRGMGGIWGETRVGTWGVTHSISGLETEQADLVFRESRFMKATYQHRSWRRGQDGQVSAAYLVHHIIICELSYKLKLAKTSGSSGTRALQVQMESTNLNGSISMVGHIS